jgi:Putative DNA-binding domain
LGDTAEFAAGLLNPRHPVPLLVKGQIERRYAVYRNNVTVGLIRALEANFPTVRRLLGEQYFQGFARDFAQHHPPHSPLMFQYGVDFPQALENAVDLANYPYLGDIARLEILWRESYDANPLATDALASMEPDHLFDCRLTAHPAMRLIQSRFAVHSIFAANRPGGEGQVVDLIQSQCVLITRPHYDVAVHAITPDQFEFFLALQDGLSFGDALDRAATIEPSFDISGTLALLLQSGAFQSIQQSDEQTT